MNLNEMMDEKIILTQDLWARWPLMTLELPNIYTFLCKSNNKITIMSSLYQTVKTDKP